tara:strand:- start:123 stop:473 length:351 start_codon:yes stop_codon:yes gene_type:complete
MNAGAAVNVGIKLFLISVMANIKKKIKKITRPQAASHKRQASSGPEAHPKRGWEIRALRQPQPPAKYIGFYRICQEIFCRRTLESRIRSGARQSFKPQAASFKRQATSVKLESLVS